jgi:hypothetical protein
MTFKTVRKMHEKLVWSRYNSSVVNAWCDFSLASGTLSKPMLEVRVTVAAVGKSAGIGRIADPIAAGVAGEAMLVD